MELLKNVEYKLIQGNGEIFVSGITSNSNNIEEGNMFLAIPGDSTDGHKFINSAIQNGAKSVLVENIPDILDEEITYLQVDDSRVASAYIASNYYGSPSKDLTLIGITGTNGKTTITYLLEAIWNEDKKPNGVIGTVENRYGSRKIESTLTTPDSIELNKLLWEMKSEGVKYVAMEVSSHALDKKRVESCHFDIAVFTNLSQDHLDYHKNMENYFESKKSLFTNILSLSSKKSKTAIINIDDKYGKLILDELNGDVITYSLDSKNSDIFPENYSISSQGINANINTPLGNINITSKLLGKHNLLNIIAAIAISIHLGSNLINVENALKSIEKIPGRLETIENSRKINVAVDYAHTPDALKSVLEAIKPIIKGNLILVFGCGGDRDRDKRPLMGEIGIKNADYLIVTSDNPRTESPELIIDDIVDGLRNSKYADKDYRVIVNREKAIEEAIEIATIDDFVLIAGKGHEDYQIIGDKKIHFDDRELAKNILNKERIIN